MIAVGVICGTGMGALGEKVKPATVIPYKEIPHFPVSTVESHKGNLVLGKLAGRRVMMMQGRFHTYEGYTMKQVTFPVRVMAALGMAERTNILINAPSAPSDPTGLTDTLTMRLDGSGGSVGGDGDAQGCAGRACAPDSHSRNR